MSSTSCRRNGSGSIPPHLACAAGKAVYCALPLAGNVPELESLIRRVDETGIAFMPEFARRCYPATLRLKELLATSLGPPRLVLGFSRLFGFDRYAVPGPSTQTAPAPLLIDPGSFLIDWCAFLMQTLPTAIRGTQCMVLPSEAGANAEPDFESFVATFPDGATAQIGFGRYYRTRWGEATRFLPASGFQVYAERGAAWLEMPERIQWWDASGTHEERLPLEPTIGDVLNDQFHRLVHKGQSLAPTIHDALVIARLVQDLKSSQERGPVMSPAAASC